MADSSIEILIKTIADTTGIQLTEEQAAKLNETMAGLNSSAGDLNTHLPEGAALWAKYKNQLQDATGQAEKLGLGHHQLFYVMEQMQMRLPGLGFLLRGMITPGTIATLGLVSAWELWNKRIEEGTAALAGMQLPDLSSHVQQLSQAAANAKAYSEALRAVTDAYNSIDAGSDRITKKIKDETEAQKKLAEARRDVALAALDSVKGSMTDAEYNKRKAQITGGANAEIEALQKQGDQKEIAELKRRQGELTANAEVKREAASRIKVASADTDENNLADAKAQADAAKESKTKSQEWINRIATAQDSKLQAIENVPEYYLRYGFMPGSQATKLEQSNVANADVVINRYNDMVKEKAARDDERAHRQKLLEDAGKMQGEADVLNQSIPQESAARATAERNQGTNDHLKRLQETMRAGDQAAVLLLQDIIHDQGNTKAAIDDLARQLKAIAGRNDRPRQ